MTEYIPLGTKILLKKLPKPESKPGKILTLDEPKEKMLAEVIDWGDDSKWHEQYIPCPTIVRYAPYSAQVIDEENPDYLIVDEKDIWCIVRST